MPVRAVALLACVALTGCYSFTVLGRARTVERGRFELVAAPGVTGTAVLGADANVRPALEAGARYGVSDALDVGLRVNDSGGAVTARVQALRSAQEDSGLDVLVAPGLAYTVTDRFALELPVLFGVRLPGRHQLVLSLRVVEQLRTGVGGLDHPAQFFFVGGSVGFAWQVADRVALFPELALLANVYAEPGFGSFAQAGPALQAALAVLWDP